MNQNPSIIYGTAWKEERTADLVKKAVACGFRAIDTANQKKHYREDYVGEALNEIYRSIPRAEFFLQSKYTYQRGQDHRLPYNPEDDFPTQVRSSFTSSLKNLHTDYLDSFVLHGPMSNVGLQDEDWEVWGEMESLVGEGLAKKIGVSNIGLRQLDELVRKAKVRPAFVQNRCYAIRGWDRQVREFCRENGIIYQGFSLLTANPQVVMHAQVGVLAEKYSATREQVVLRFSQQVGMVPLTGTTNEKHMREDLAIGGFELTKAEVMAVEGLG